jgi:hypothetical protein
MEFNDKWTKEINDKYRQMIKEHKTPDEIREYFGDLIHHHPKKKFSTGSVLTYSRFEALLNEIKFYPNYIHFSFREVNSNRYTNKKDFECYFEINDIEYILILEYLIENNKLFNNQVVYNVLFTTKEQYSNFKKLIYNLSSEEIENKFLELQNLIEKETNYNDAIKIFNALSYILLKMRHHIENCIYMISETDDERKFNFYIKSIEDSFKKYEDYNLIIDESIFLPGKKSYYYIIKNN